MYVYVYIYIYICTYTHTYHCDTYMHIASNEAMASSNLWQHPFACVYIEATTLAVIATSIYSIVSYGIVWYSIV